MMSSRAPELTPEQARDVYAWERSKRPLPPEPECPYTKDDARWRWRMRQHRASGWKRHQQSAEERHKLSIRVALTGWVE
jgi:hypothetical protein